jgi:dGTPase
VDDGIRAALISIEQLMDITLFRQEYDVVHARYPALDEKRTRHEVIRRMINRLVCDLVDTSLRAHWRCGPGDVPTTCAPGRAPDRVQCEHAR